MQLAVAFVTLTQRNYTTVLRTLVLKGLVKGCPLAHWGPLRRFGKTSANSGVPWDWKHQNPFKLASKGSLHWRVCDPVSPEGLLQEAGHLGQDHLLLIFFPASSGCACQSLTVKTKHYCSLRPACTTLGTSHGQPVEKELTFVLIGVTHVSPAISPTRALSL